MRLLLTAILLISASAISYEILLIRLLSIVQWHHFAWMVISLALLGYGASGTAIALARPWLEPRFKAAFSISALLFSLTTVACFVAGQQVPFNVLEVAWNPRQFLYLCILYLIFMLPFFFAAFCIGLAFTFLGKSSERIYLFDLLGAGLGAVALIFLLFLLAPQQALIVLAALALTASAIVLAQSLRLRSPAGKFLAAVQLAWLIALIALAPEDRITLRISEFKGLSQALQVVDSRVLEQSSSPLGLLTAVASPTVPFRYAPGLSYSATRLPPEQVALFTDGDSFSAINRWDGTAEELDYLTDVTAALPYRLLERPEVLILGAGAGSDVLLALRNGAARVDAVELNPQVIDLLNGRFSDYSGNLYEHEQVEVHLSEARGFVERTASKYDLIQVGLLDSFTASGAGTQTLNESHLYTVEALALYLRSLKPGGLLAITRWLKVPPRDSLKLSATAIEAMRQISVPDPARRLAVIRSWNTVTMLVKNGDLSLKDIAAIRAFSGPRFFDTAYYPAMPRGEANRFNRQDEPWLSDGIFALLGSAAGRYMDDYKFNIRPATDDRPYFFHFFKWRVLPEVLRLRERSGAGLIEWGYIVLATTLAQAFLVGFAMILLPLMLSRRRQPARRTVRMGTYFFALGMAFLFVEIAFIQKFILFLSHPLYAVAVVLAGFLLFAGLGSGYSAKLYVKCRNKHQNVVWISVAGITGITLLYIAVLPGLFHLLGGQPDWLRIFVSAALIAPLAFCMGMPFPMGLKRLASEAPDYIPWAWAINGFASVISAALAALLALHLGFTTVLLLALLLYGLAALVMYRSSEPMGIPGR